MDVVMTGGTGFIGRALCEQLLSHGHAVCVLSRAPARARLPGARCVGTLDEVGPVDAVVNLAGASLSQRRWTAARKRLLRDSRLSSTRRLVAWMAQQSRPPAVLVSASAIGYYGPRGDELLDERAAPGSDFGAELCRDWEHEAQQASALGVRVCRLRIGVVLGQGGGALAQMLPAYRLGLGGAMGDGRQWMSWIQREDLLRLMLWALDNPAVHGAFNATAPQPVRNREFATALAAALRRPALLPLPAWALRLGFGEMSGLLLQGQRVLPAAAQTAGFEFHYPSLAGALATSLRRCVGP